MFKKYVQSYFHIVGLIGLGTWCIGIEETIATPSAMQYRQQGLAYRQQGKFVEAIAALSQAVNLKPNSTGYVILGWTQHLAGQPKEAARSLWQAIYDQPQTVEAFNALGIVYLVQGELSSAVLSHHWAAWLKPQNEIAYYNLSLAYGRQGELALAIAYAKQSIILEPNNPHPLVSLAIAHWQDGNQMDAKKVMLQTISLDSRYRDRNFLDFLAEAGFSNEQITIAKNVLIASLK